MSAKKRPKREKLVLEQQTRADKNTCNCEQCVALRKHERREKPVRR